MLMSIELAGRLAHQSHTGRSTGSCISCQSKWQRIYFTGNKNALNPVSGPQPPVFREFLAGTSALVLTAIPSNDASQAGDSDERGSRHHTWVTLQVADQTWTPETREHLGTHNNPEYSTTSHSAGSQSTLNTSNTKMPKCLLQPYHTKLTSHSEAGLPLRHRCASLTQYSPKWHTVTTVRVTIKRNKESSREDILQTV